MTAAKRSLDSAFEGIASSSVTSCLLLLLLRLLKDLGLSCFLWSLHHSLSPYVAPLCSEKAMLRLPSSCLFVAEKKGIQSGSNTGLILT